MIFEIATAIQDNLDDAAVAVKETQDLPALDKERALLEAEAQQKAEESEARKLQQQRVAEDEEARILSEMVERERSRLARVGRKSRPSEIAEQNGEDMTFDQEMRATTRQGTVVAFRSISRSSKAKHREGHISSIYTVHPTESDASSLPFLALKECSIPVSSSEEERLKKLVQSLETNLEALMHLPTHASILQPLGFHIEKSSVQKIWRVSVLMNFADRGSIKDLLEAVGHLDIRNVRSWIFQILEGLDFFHRHRIVHARLKPENLLLERTEAGDTIIKLSDGLYQHDLYLMKKDDSAKFSSAISAYWIAPEAASNISAKPTSPRDIWDTGVLLLQLVFGLDIQRQYNSPSMLIETMNLSPSFEALLTCIFKADPKKRPSAFELLPNEFLRNDDPVIDEDSPLSSRANSMPLYGSSKPFRLRHDSSHLKTTSRYANDFVEFGRLGKGGFGEVVRARNKLDGTMYAIKKITQTSTAALSGVLSEVMLLSRLNHPFIVRYYTAWIEEEGMLRQEDVLSEISEPSNSLLSHIPTSNTQGLDFISSSGYPAIEFGYDNDDEDPLSEAVVDEDDSTEELENVPSLSVKARRRSSGNVTSKVTLYIQMEYCDRQTLRDLMRGELHTNIEECWRLFRQILEGLVHVHSNGVIHRDLKPENIFITLGEANTVRLGDFGLARPGEATNKSALKSFVDPRLTASIGTSIYVAPEVRSSGGGSYNEKADMYSLGIILFEMSYPLETGMERAQILGNIRRDASILPSAFNEAEKMLQGDVIRALLKHKVSERPSSQELLRSGKIPSQVEDETIRTVLQSLSDESSPFHVKLMNGLFSRPREEPSVKDYTYDLDIGSNFSSEELLLHSLIKDKLVEVFRRHGAVETRRPQLIPSSNYYTDTAARFLDSTGSLVQLPYDLTLPFARILAKIPAVGTARKSYTFGNVFRATTIALHPSMHGEVDFDIVSTNSFDLALREAEVIKVVDEIMDALPSLANAPIVYHISHSKLLNTILSYARIPQDKLPAVKQVISKLNIGQWTWTMIRNELRSPAIAVASTSLDDLLSFDFRDPYDVAIPKLRSLLQNTDELESTFRHLEAVVTYLERFRIRRKIFVTPLASVNEKFYHGNVLFQCISDGKKKRVLCAGGRYDRLIQEHRTGSRLVDKHAVGFNLAWENLVESMARFQKASGKAFLKKTEEAPAPTWKGRRCDVLIDSSDPAILRSSGIKLVQELWENDISAELVIDADVRETTSHHQQSKEESITHDWIVLIKQDETLKVRSMISKEDTEIRAAELLTWLRLEIRDRDRLEGRNSKSQPRMTQSESTDREAGVHIVAQSKSKKTNRRAIVDDGKISWSLLRSHRLAFTFLNLHYQVGQVFTKLPNHRHNLYFPIFGLMPDH